ncbi:NUDIX hydrolase domain-like protein [Colletotrichum phormii]|uniref:NUDIX hydrolase domain-like protein n=1 Tax=Colletotrichum phormii TaxID=359342 RepID=A0AAI9ZDV6_9PEZI|nr:NUDIX hydrolase domain-like protein [Colletotrichum phormii]KAK1621790.1 NUDIX hydrolase domain-like protein [Colletotrichum phormii]
MSNHLFLISSTQTASSITTTLAIKKSSSLILREPLKLSAASPPVLTKISFSIPLLPPKVVPSTNMATPTLNDPKHQFPRVGVTAIIERNGKVIVGKRMGSHGSGMLQMPGGHQEKGELHFECAVREIKEETDLDIKAIEYGPITEDIFEKEGRQYTTVHVWCKMIDESQEPKLMEEYKCEGWAWMSAQDLRDSVHRGEAFLPVKHLVEHQGGANKVLEILEERAEAYETAVRLAEQVKLDEQTKLNEQAKLNEQTKLDEQRRGEEADTAQ